MKGTCELELSEELEPGCDDGRWGAGVFQVEEQQVQRMGANKVGPFREEKGQSGRQGWAHRRPVGQNKDGHTFCDSLPLRGGVCDRTVTAYGRSNTVPISGPRPSEADSFPSLS